MSKKLIIKVCDPDFIEPFEFRDSYFFRRKLQNYYA